MHIDSSCRIHNDPSNLVPNEFDSHCVEPKAHYIFCRAFALYARLISTTLRLVSRCEEETKSKMSKSAKAFLWWRTLCHSWIVFVRPTTTLLTQSSNQQKGQRLKDNLILAAITAAWILQIWTFVVLVFTVGCLGFGARGRASHWDQLNLPSLPKWSIDSPLYIVVINRYT